MENFSNFNFADYFLTIILGVISGTLVILLRFTLAKRLIKGEKSTALSWYSRLFLVDGIILLGVLPFGVFGPLSNMDSTHVNAKGWIIACVMYFFSHFFYDKKFDPRRW